MYIITHQCLSVSILMSDNQIGDSGGSEMAEALKVNSTLTRLSLNVSCENYFVSL